MLGPLPGYSPQIGTFVSQLTWMREANGVLGATERIDPGGSRLSLRQERQHHRRLMLHLAATETYYQMNTFDGMKWDSWSDDIKKKWDPPMNLGDAGRATIKGHDREYYVSILHEVREKTLAEFRKKDDAWFSPPTRVAVGTDQQSLQVVPRLRARSTPHRPDCPAPQTPPRRQARCRLRASG